MSEHYRTPLQRSNDKIAMLTAKLNTREASLEIQRQEIELMHARHGSGKDLKDQIHVLTKSNDDLDMSLLRLGNQHADKVTSWRSEYATSYSGQYAEEADLKNEVTEFERNTNDQLKTSYEQGRISSIVHSQEIEKLKQTVAELMASTKDTKIEELQAIVDQLHKDQNEDVEDNLEKERQAADKLTLIKKSLYDYFTTETDQGGLHLKTLIVAVDFNSSGLDMILQSLRANLEVSDDSSSDSDEDVSELSLIF